MDRNAAVALPAPAPSYLRLADCSDLDDGETGDGPTRMFSPDPSHRGPGAETTVSASVSEPAPRAPADGYLAIDDDDVAEVLEGRLDLMLETNPKVTAIDSTAVTVAPVDRTMVSTPICRPSTESPMPAGTQIVLHPILRTPEPSGTQVVANPVLLTPEPSGTQVTERPVFVTPELGVPMPLALDKTDLRVSQAHMARVILAGRYLAGGDEGSEAAYNIGNSMLIARTADSAFCDDPYVDAEHGALTFRPDGIAIEDFDSTNGIFVRVRDRATLRCGDMFRAGEELLRFTALRTSRGAGRAPTLGSPDPGYWGRIDVMISQDSNAASYPIDDTEVSFGQTDGHLQFPDDPYLGELHCSVVKQDKGAALVDHGSPCGTWLRLRAGDVVPYGAELLIGQTRVRIEAV